MKGNPTHRRVRGFIDKAHLVQEMRYVIGTIDSCAGYQVEHFSHCLGGGLPQFAAPIVEAVFAL